MALGAGSLAILLLLPRFARRVPAPSSRCAVSRSRLRVFHLPVETIGSKFGGIPSGLPPFAIPDFHSEHILPLLPSAFTVALLAALESMLSAVVADGMTGDRHNPNVELVAQGIANMASPIFGGIPATGAIARTATNIRAGARTPVSGMVHALTLLAILLVAAPLASYIPLATLAAVLFVVAYNMGEWNEIGAHPATGFRRHFRLADHVRADRFCRSHGRGGRGPCAGGAALHLSRCRHHVGFAGDRRLHSRRACRTCCRVASFRPTLRSCAFTGRSSSGRRRSWWRPPRTWRHFSQW